MLQLVTLIVLVYHAIALTRFINSHGGAGLLYARIVVENSDGSLAAACSAARIAKLPRGINGSVLRAHGGEWSIPGGPVLCNGMRVQGLDVVAANASSLVDAGGSLVAIHAARLPSGLRVYWSIEYIEPMGLLEQLAPIAVAVIAVLEDMRVGIGLASAC